MSLSLIVLFPLIGFLINGVLQLWLSRNHKKSSAQVSGLLASAAMFLSFAVAAYQATRLFLLPKDKNVMIYI